MARIPLSTGSYASRTPGLFSRVAENCYVEKSKATPDGQLQIVARHGTLALPSWVSASRGYEQSDGFAGGKIIAVVGSAIKTYDTVTQAVGTIPGTIAGSDRVVIKFTETEIGILGGGSFNVGTATQIRRVTDGVLTDPALGIGSTPANVASAAFSYSINGTTYAKGAVAAGTAPGNDVVPINKYGAVAFDINAAGTITAIEAPANATGYATAADAVLALPDAADATVRIGYVTAIKTDGPFTFGTTSLAAANTTVVYTDSDVNTAWTDLLTDHDQTEFIDLLAIGQRFVLPYGSRFCYSAALNGASTTALNYYTAEYAPDGLIAGKLFAERAMFLGGQTIEPWEETGDNDDPFRRSLGQIIPVGCKARDAVRVMDGALYWVDQHNQIRRTGNALTPDTLSGPDVSANIAAASDIMAFVMEFEGHAMYALRMPERCVVFDANYNEFCDFKTLNSDTWRYGYALRVGGKIYLGDADSTGFAVMGEAYKSDHMPDADTMGTERTWRVSGFVLTETDRPLGPLRWEGGKGVGLESGQGSDPLILMRRSLKGPSQYSAWRSRSIGALGRYDKNVVWNQNGIVYAPGCLIELKGSDPVDYITTGFFEDA